MKFSEFEKIPRLNREIIITEKIDGTNGLVHIEQAELLEGIENPPPAMIVESNGMKFAMMAGSRSRYITPEDDNYGFARWVSENRDELIKLGPGAHYGEWWGSGVQRGYGLPKGEKRFSLFNVHRWKDDVRPSCCHVVPTLWRGLFSTDQIRETLKVLETGGSQAAPGFMRPEGIIVYHVAGQHLYKVTLEKDSEPKSRV